MLCQRLRVVLARNTTGRGPHFNGTTRLDVPAGIQQRDPVPDSSVHAEPAADPGSRAGVQPRDADVPPRQPTGCWSSTTTRRSCSSGSRSPSSATIDGLEFGSVLQMSELDGAPVRRRDSPAGIAFAERRPSHQQLLVTGYDGVRRAGRSDRVSAVRRARRAARRGGRVLGRQRRPTVPADARPGLGLSWFARRARRGHGSLRRQHLVRRGAPRERSRPRARRRYRDAPARRRARRDDAGPSSTSSSRTCTWITCRGWASSGRCSSPVSTCTSGGRRRRCRRSPSGSRSTSRRRCSPCGSPTSPRASPSTTPTRTASRSGRR